MLRRRWGCYASHCSVNYGKVCNIHTHFILRGFLSWPDFPCLKGPQVTLKRPESLKQHNNKFTFNFWPYSWRFLVVWERNALVPRCLKTAENSFFKCLKEKTSSLSFPQIRGSTQEINPKKEVKRQSTSFLPSSWTCPSALAQCWIAPFNGLAEFTTFLAASSCYDVFKASKHIIQISAMLEFFILCRHSENAHCDRSQLPSTVSP